MREMLKALLSYLKDRREIVVRTVEVRYGDSDPTYGQPVIATFETIDFDKLLIEIDEFSETFK